MMFKLTILSLLTALCVALPDPDVMREARASGTDNFRNCLTTFYNGTAEVLCLPKERINTDVCGQEIYDKLKRAKEFVQCPEAPLGSTTPAPPKNSYESVEGYLDCVFENQIGTAITGCLPPVKPDACTDDAYSALKADSTLQQCPPPPAPPQPAPVPA